MHIVMPCMDFHSWHIYSEINGLSRSIFIHEKRFKYIEVRLLLIFLFKFDLIAKFYKKLEYRSFACTCPSCYPYMWPPVKGSAKRR